MVPERYEDDDERQELIQSIVVVPFTVRMGFEEASFSYRTKLMIHLMAPTFDANSCVKHPLEPVIWATSATAGRPPACLAKVLVSEDDLCGLGAVQPLGLGVEDVAPALARLAAHLRWQYAVALSITITVRVRQGGW